MIDLFVREQFRSAKRAEGGSGVRRKRTPPHTQLDLQPD